MTHVTYRLTAKNRDQLRNTTSSVIEHGLPLPFYYYKHLVCTVVVDGLYNCQVGFLDALPAEGDSVDITSYPICGSQLNIPVQVGKLVELDCDRTVSEAAQYQYVIIQSLDTIGERLCLAEIRVYEPGQYAVAFVLFVIHHTNTIHNNKNKTN